ncbi:hypothetical protein [uncultured Sphingomonas sp.]|jgi:hypothetical protein|uniref:hypothetical protein n=1 Tax=uncultured Sphingomonas sp. TaxID=158754 RepID=UPI0025E13521|nr:hypothetical protein [uncultured Sphingomonas sp.]
MATVIPEEILASMRAAAKLEWPGDRDMQEWMLENELSAYRAIHDLDFGAANSVREAIMREADEFSETWEDRSTIVLAEVEAFNALQALQPEDVPAELVADLKRRAAAEEDRYEHQLEEVNGGIEHYRYVQRTRAAVAPRRDLMVRMERILGSECYNDNIQNYSSWGAWEGEGRSFRYPVTFVRDGRTEKRRQRTDDLAAEELITGHYKFGANDLSVYRALMKIIDMLETDYRLDLAAGAPRGSDR